MKRPSAPASPAISEKSGRSGPAQNAADLLFGGAGSSSAPAAAARPNRESVQSKAQQLAEKLADERRHAAWLNGFRFSAFSLVMAGVLAIGVLSLIPRIQELVTQRQQIDALNADIAATKADIAAKEAERAQWNDPTFVATQARERLYFVQPGDVSYLVINDLGPGALTAPSETAASAGVHQTESHWLGALVGSVWSAGNAPVTEAK